MLVRTDVDAPKAKPTPCRIEFATKRPDAFRRLLAWSSNLRSTLRLAKRVKIGFADRAKGGRATTFM
jgi:hypothetical protein